MPELILNNVTRKFKQKTAVDNISLQLHPGVYGFLGANGAGKTTLLRMLCGVLKPTSGEIRCNGMEIQTLDAQYRCMLGYLPQDFGYYPDFTATRYLEYLAACKAIPKELAALRVPEMLALAGLQRAAGQKIKTFSGGMLRRLGIAQALLNDPDILILDEPTCGLDPKERIRFRNVISALSKGRIIILSTHIVSDVDFISDKILLMKQGKLILQGTRQEITDSIKGHVWEYLASPAQAARIQASFAVSNLRHCGENVYLRLINDTCPCKGATAVQPGLEDVYLYYFKEASDHVEHLEGRSM
ncbi:MAG: ABC transporter ATP-binding protein [Eubacterium sp.]|jgi:ABC-2 type transport system ATP-binding protein|nr:ABC transporter ATP-binding protein [Eubacterium sp.]